MDGLLVKRDYAGRYLKGTKLGEETKNRMSLGQSGKNHWNWKGGKPWLDKDGYIIVYIEGDGRVRRCRHILEIKIGRILEADEHCHHINGIKTDDRPENLEAKNNREHMTMHQKLPAGKWAKNYNECLRCLRTSLPHDAFGFCSSCLQRFRRMGDM